MVRDCACRQAATLLSTGFESPARSAASAARLMTAMPIMYNDGAVFELDTARSAEAIAGVKPPNAVWATAKVRDTEVVRVLAGNAPVANT